MWNHNKDKQNQKGVLNIEQGISDDEVKTQTEFISKFIILVHYSFFNYHV